MKQDASSDYYYAYGSNMNLNRVLARKMAFSHCEAGTLDGYKLVFNKRSEKHPGSASANVGKDIEHIVEGVVYHLHNDTQIAVMDPFEGHPIRYSRVKLPIKIASGVVDAWVYIANEDYIETGLKPNEWYLEHLLAGREFLSENYFQRLRAVKCTENSKVEPV